MRARVSLPRAPPGRPPSRPDRRPRAGGTRGSARAPRARCVSFDVRAEQNTCSYSMRSPRTEPTEHTCASAEADGDLAQLSQIEPLGPATESCRSTRCLTARRRSNAAARAGPRPPCANSTHMAVTLAGTTPRRSDRGPPGAPRSPWRSSSSKAASRSPARSPRPGTRTRRCRSRRLRPHRGRGACAQRAAHPRRRGDGRDPRAPGGAGELAGAPRALAVRRRAWTASRSTPSSPSRSAPPSCSPGRCSRASGAP